MIPNNHSKSLTKTGFTRWHYDLPRDSWVAGYPANAHYYYDHVHTVTWADTKTGYKLPGWKRLVKSGSDATTPYNRAFSTVEGEGGSGSVSWVYSASPPGRIATVEVSGFQPKAPPQAVPFDGFIKADNQALIRLYKAIQEEYRQFQSLVFLGELGESVRMLRKPFSQMQGHIERYLTRVNKRAVSIKAAQKRAILGRDRKGRPIYRTPSAKELEQMVHATWLEASFGMRPLLADTADIATTLARLSDSIRRSRVAGFGASPGVSYVSPRYTGSYADLAYFWHYRDDSSWRVKYRAGVSNALNAPDSLSRLRQLAGFTPNEFVPTLYELLPWSFLADYFFNVGDCLSSYWTCRSYVTWANQSTLGENVRTYIEMVDHAAIKAAKGNTYRGSTGSYLPGTCKASRLSVGRSVLDVANMPQPMLDSKRFSDWNPMKVANVVALLRSKSKVVSRTLTASRG